MKVKDINFLKESIRQIECEVIKPKIGKYEEIKDHNWEEILTQLGNIEIYTFLWEENTKWRIKKP